ncbi:MAG: HlyD family type I secretion periplasmic adaptor subunit [Candidatus Thiothrix singaporensis]|uniref:Membrane fusion protein (MFP) family protein n=1 Tax=Candidatus Thiothrix singaporensis TaxID=2799669 RepID=A0A7L6ANI7_9GAMM|nr:MAG: HlyD family type I secretion periplasmic adaptor subunit [Candidatus Thiothrix singaporensis]
MAAQLAKIEIAKMPSIALAGLKTPVEDNVVPLQTDDVVYQRLGLWILVLIFGIFAVWAAFAPLGSHAVASGKVVVQAEKQVIQHREGVIEEIFVTDGDRVVQGQKLMLISPTDAKAEKGIVMEQLLSSMALEARLNAQLEGFKQISFPVELTTSKHERSQFLMMDEQQQFKVSTAAAAAEDTVLEQRVQRLREQLQGTDAQIDSQRELSVSYSREMNELQGLFARQLVSKLQLNEAERNYLSVKTKIAELESTKAGLGVQIGEAEEQLVLQTNNRKKEVADKLSDTRAKIADLRNRLDAADDKLERTVVTAPMAGTVVSLAYHTKGGVVPPGGKILEIVPDASGFEVEAQVSITDIDKVHVGLPADIRFPAFPAISFLKSTLGEVTYVSADALVDETHGKQYYLAKIKLDPEGVDDLAKHKLKLVQGMPAEASIKSGERTFLDYLLKPISSMVNHAFNED